MKHRVARLKRLVQSALSQEDRALRAMASATQSIAAQESACERLKSFHQEYSSRRHGLLVGQQSGRQLANMSAFVDRLQGEIRAAEETLEKLKENLEGRRQAWLQYRLRRQRFEVVLQQGQDQLRELEARYEQATYDDWTSFRGGTEKDTACD
jgi:flagellar export protein FliJ